MKKLEAEFGRLFRHWIAQEHFPSSAFELKHTRGKDRLPFSDVQEHQLSALLAVKKASLLYKIPDDSAGVKPFDMMFFHKAEAYVVIRYPNEFVLIDVEKFIEEAEWNMEKSLTSARAVEISHTHVPL